MTSAPAGIEEALPTLLMRSPSTRTTALGMILPVPSTSFPNRIAFIGAPDLSAAKAAMRLSSRMFMLMGEVKLDGRNGRKATRSTIRLMQILAMRMVRSSQLKNHRLLGILLQAGRLGREGERFF